MASEFSRSVLQVSVAQLCQHLGWQVVQSTPLEMLTDILERYILDLGRFTHRYSEEFGRTEPNLDDLGLAFHEMGVNIPELADYAKQVEPPAFCLEVPQYPVPKGNMLRFPKPNSRELLEREDHVHDYLPAMNPDWDEEILPSKNAISPLLGAGNSLVPGEEFKGPSPTTPSAAAGDKRTFTSPEEAAAAAKKARLSLPEEAGHSQYEMVGVRLSVSGIPAPTMGEGILPEANAPPPPTPSTPLTGSPPFTPVRNTSQREPTSLLKKVEEMALENFKEEMGDKKISEAITPKAGSSKSKSKKKVPATKITKPKDPSKTPKAKKKKVPTATLR